MFPVGTEVVLSNSLQLNSETRTILNGQKQLNQLDFHSQRDHGWHKCCLIHKDWLLEDDPYYSIVAEALCP